MRHAHRTGLLAVCLLLLPLRGAAQDRLTLEESIRLAVRNNSGVQIAAEGVTGAQLKINESKSLYYPQVSFIASYTWMSMVSEFTIPLNGVPTTFKFMSPNNYSFRLSATEQLFNWGRTARTVDLGRSGAALARDGLELNRQLVAYQVVPFFFGVQITRSGVGVIDETIRLFEKRLDTARQRYQAGLASNFDVSLLQVQISSLREQKLDFLNAIQKTVFSFNRLCGRSPDTPFEPQGKVPYEPLALSNQQILEEALAQRLEVQQLRHQEDLSQAQVGLAKTGDKPNLLFSLNYEVRNGFLPYVDQLRGNWTAVVSAAYPIFDGFRTRAQVRQAVSALQQVRDRQDELKQSITTELQNNLADVQTLEQKLEIEKVKIGHAQEALRIAEERYRSALISTTDLIEAQNALANARLNQLQLVYNHILAKYALYRAMGRKLIE